MSEPEQTRETKPAVPALTDLAPDAVPPEGAEQAKGGAAAAPEILRSFINSVADRLPK